MFSLLLVFLLAVGAAPAAQIVPVRNDAELRAALRDTKPGTRIELAPGGYTGGLYVAQLRGAAGRPIVIAAADPQKPPRIVGGATGLHLSDPAFVELHDLHFTGAKANGVSIDDGRAYSPTPRGLVLRGLRITDIGPRGNSDGLKLSGVDGFRVEDCVIERWGAGSGSGIDMVGCHDGLIIRCTFRHDPDPRTTGGSGVQAKGGSRAVIIRQNRFEHAGQRAVNLGGSTGLEHFRPPLDRLPSGAERWEASDLIVEGNTFIGSLAPLCFVGVNSATVRFNTIYRPAKWTLRILQENQDPAFVPSRGGILTDNLIVFDSDQNSVNTSGGTAPGTFRFARNHWHCTDQPAQSRPRLPSEEEDGTYSGEPQFQDITALDLRQIPTSPARTKGADALPATR